MKKQQTHWIFGFHAIESAVEKQPENIIEIMFDASSKNSRGTKLTNNAKNLGLKLTPASAKKLNQYCKERHHGIIALLRVAKLADENQLKHDIKTLTQPLILILDTIEDPRNLGACLRSADAAGVDCVIFSKHKSSGMTPVTNKTAAGAVENLKIYQVTNIVKAIEILKDNGVWIAATDCNAGSKSIYQTDLTGSFAIVLGNEGKGVRPLVKKHSDYLVHIPMYGAVQSLNVSVATGIALFEARRQRA